jgi:phage/conjugal plasmid C-4 type zinc finger TraR family protein
MADIADLAQDYEERFLAEALSRLPHSAGTVTPPAERDCYRCGDPIGTLRLAAIPDAKHCIDCKEWIEGR